MNAVELEGYLHRHIPLSRAMRAAVADVGLEAVTLSAPLEPNLNHQHTAFGGSLATLGVLSAWSLVHVRLLHAGVRCGIVIQSSTMSYDRPAEADFSARSTLVDEAAWPLFLRTLRHRGLARIDVRSTLRSEGAAVGVFGGWFVASLIRS